MAIKAHENLLRCAAVRLAIDPMKPPALTASRPKRRARVVMEAAPLVAPTLAFQGTDALIELGADATTGLAAVWLDGAPLPRDRWRLTGDAALRVSCPPTAFDTQPHTLRLLWAEEAAAMPLELNFRSEYRCAIDTLDDKEIAGWIYDVLRPATTLTLDVLSGPGPAFGVLNTLDHPHLLASAPEVNGGGFTVPLPPRRARARAELLHLTVRGTGHAPFGPILRGSTLPGAVMAAASAGRTLGLTAPGLLFRTVLLPAMVRALRGQPEAVAPDLLDGAGRLGSSHGLPRTGAPRVDIVIPVYRGLHETLDCIASVLASTSRIGHRVTIIDDCSPDAALTDALRALAAEGHITYLRNEENLGFVATANRGMALAPDCDVLLLNADTLVPAGFLDRLYRARVLGPGDRHRDPAVQQRHHLQPAAATRHRGGAIRADAGRDRCDLRRRECRRRARHPDRTRLLHVHQAHGAGRCRPVRRRPLRRRLRRGKRLFAAGIRAGLAQRLRGRRVCRTQGRGVLRRDTRGQDRGQSRPGRGAVPVLP